MFCVATCLSCLIRRLGDPTQLEDDSQQTLPAMEPIDVDEEIEESGQAEGDVETPEALEKIRLAKALPADATVPATPPPAASPASPVQPGSSVAATVNSSTHRQSYMRFARFGKNKIQNYPEMARMWNASGKQKQDLFAKWVQSQEDPEAIEGTLKITASQKKTGEAKQELLTVPEMRARGLSEAKLSLTALGFHFNFLILYACMFQSYLRSGEDRSSDQER